MARVFVAAIPPPDIRKTVCGLFTEAERRESSRTGDGARWSVDADLHCTLLFLGDIDLIAATEALICAAPSLSATRAQLVGTTSMLGADALVIPVDGLDTLAARVGSQVGDLTDRAKREHHHFSGHLTVRRGLVSSTTSGLIGRQVPPASWTVSTISLMTNSSSGHGYRVIHTIDLPPAQRGPVRSARISPKDVQAR